jgi:Predicted membrane-bound metal-dependent hydrolases
MPSPIAHSLAGYVVYGTTSKRTSCFEWRKLSLYCVYPLLADLDFIPGFLVGAPNQFHHGISHSLGFALGFGLLMSFVLLFMSNQIFLKNFVVFFSLYFSHVLLDLFSYDTSVPYGVPALWPITDSYYISPVPTFFRYSKRFGFRNIYKKPF